MSEQTVQNNPADAFPEVTNDDVPVGTVMMYAGILNEASGTYLRDYGWLICDGSLLEQDDYKDLWQAIRGSYGIDGTKFYIPDCRGLFVRGVDQGSSYDPDAEIRTPQNRGGNTGDNVGTHQDDQFKEHSHTYEITEKTGYSPIASQGQFGTESHYNPLSTSESGGSETRPKNIAFYYIIKYRSRV